MNFWFRSRSCYASSVNSRAFHLLLVLIMWFTSGSVYVALRAVAPRTPPFLMMGARYLIGGAIVFAAMNALQRGAPERRTAAHWKAACIIGALLFLGAQGCFVWASRDVPAGIMSLLLASIPIWGALLAFFAFGERPTPLEALGMAVGMGGIIYLILPSLQHLAGGVHLPSALIALLGAIFAAGGAILSAYLPGPRSALMTSSMQMLTGGALFMIASAISGDWRALPGEHLDSGVAWAFVYLIVIGSLLGQQLFMWLVRNVSAALANTYAYGSPLVAIFLGWLVLGEAVTLHKLLAAGIIVSGVALMLFENSKHAKRVLPAEAAT